MLPKLKRVCNMCGGDGKTSKGITPCPKCGKVFKDVKFTSANIRVEDSEPTYLDILLTKPGFNIQDFQKFYSYMADTPAYKQMEYSLKQLVKYVVMGDLPICSYFISINSEEITNTLAETILATMHRSGKKIFPYTRANTLFDLRVNKDKFNDYPNYKDFKQSDIYSSDILCVYLNLEHQNVKHFVTVLLDVIDIRADHNKPTLVFTSQRPNLLFNEYNLNNHASIRQFRKRLRSPKQMTKSYSSLLYLGC